MPEVVYVLQNPAFNHLVKIGRTSGRVITRARQLMTTGVPTAFEIMFAGRVIDCRAAERAVHMELAQYRVNDRREFFQVPVPQAIGVIRPHVEEDVTEVERRSESDLQEHLDEIEFGYGVQAAELIERVSMPVAEVGNSGSGRFPHIDFIRMHLRVGDELSSIFSPEVAVVAGPKEVAFQGERMSLTRATQRLKGALGADPAAAVHYPTRYWHCQGVPLRQIYARAFGAPMLPPPKRPSR